MTLHPVALPPAKYEGLNFSFAEMEMEIDNMLNLARRFIERKSFESVIPSWRNQLSNFKYANTGEKLFWRIPEENPIETIISEGKYEPAGRKGKDVFGILSGVWEIEIPKKTRGKSSENFVLNGLASTKITIWGSENDDWKEIARWTVEIGDDTSPGCHFHTQINLENDGNGKFPKYLSVPRFPALLHTPMDALDFLLAELFQAEWHEHATKNSNFQTNWGGCQRKRITNLLNWHLEQIGKSSGSPWTFFKKRKPPKDMLIK